MRNSLTELKTEEARQQAYYKAVANHEYAYDENMHKFLLRDVPVHRVEYIGGAWRVQRIFNKKITEVRGQKFVLGTKIDKQEKNKFDYYNAYSVCENCYGLYIIDGVNSYIVAKYDTDNGPIWGYGNTIEQARAFLGIALFDKHIDLIHAAERKTLQK